MGNLAGGHRGGRESIVTRSSFKKTKSPIINPEQVGKRLLENGAEKDFTEVMQSEGEIL